MAIEDARVLWDYFRNASKGVWKPLGLQGYPDPSRTEVLRGLHWLVESVPRGGAGLFYFAGHAVTGSGGMVLALSDFCERIADDSGLPLRRILDVLKGKSSSEKRFVLILDCCRDGRRRPIVEDVPPNVCVLYACSAGDTALELSGGGVLTRSLIECLDAASAEPGGTLYCMVRDLGRRLANHVFTWRTASQLSHELHGAGADHVGLPMARGTGRRVPSTADCARCVLEYWLGNQSEFDEHYRILGREVLIWFNIRPGTRSEEAVLSEIFEHNFSRDFNGARRDERRGSDPRGDYWLRLHLPDGGFRWRSAEMLENLLSLRTVDPKVIYRWSRGFRPSILQAIGRALENGKLRKIERHDEVEHYQLTWTNHYEGVPYEGMAEITFKSHEPPVATLSCYNLPGQEANAVSIRYLRPSLSTIHELFRSTSAFPGAD